MWRASPPIELTQHWGLARALHCFCPGSLFMAYLSGGAACIGWEVEPSIRIGMLAAIGPSILGFCELVLLAFELVGALHPSLQHQCLGPRSRAAAHNSKHALLVPNWADLRG